MPELWRILPANGESPILFTTREQLDRTLISCNTIAADRNARPGQRAAARTVARGQIQVAARIDWVDCE
jgi:hypothetical protein